MTVAITTLRSTIATALANDGVWSVFSYPPATPLANSIVVGTSDPYLTTNDNSNLTISPTAHFKISLFVPMFDNQGNLQTIEEFMIAVYQKLATSGLVYNAPAFSAPQVLSLPSGDLLNVDLNFDILTSWS
jgi:hypothetical protein